MLHLQGTANNWIDVLPLLPDQSVVKAVDRGDLLVTAKVINPFIKTMFRHWNDSIQQFDGGLQGNVKRAREYFPRFVDGTFIEKYAASVDYLQEFNEYLANSQTEDEIQDRLDWVAACCWVWENEWRTKPELAHIKLALCSAPVGNWIDARFANIAAQYDYPISYHAYTHWKDGSRSLGEWNSLSGLWNQMDQSYPYKVKWIFGESGPYEAAETGWRSKECLGGDQSLYVGAVREWLKDVKDTPAYQEGRILGFCLFTTGGGDRWKTFETKQPELSELAKMIKEEWKPIMIPPEPPQVIERKPEPIPYVDIPIPAGVDRIRFRFADSEENIIEPRKYVWVNKGAKSVRVIPLKPDLPEMGHGIDVSHWRGNIDWGMAATNADFAFVKATEGTTFQDPKFIDNWQGAKANKLPVSAFHYYRNNKDPIQQAKFFLSRIPDQPNMPLAVDIEDTNHNPNGNQIKLCLDYIETKTGIKPIIYTGAWYWDARLHIQGWEQNYFLWVAHYTTAKTPTIPKAWADWVIWQYTSSGDGTLYGAPPGPIDLNRGKLTEILL